MTNFLHEMSWVDVEKLLKKTDTVIVPLGNMEAQGPQNPVGCCFILANETTKLVTARTGVPAIPTVPFGVAKGFQKFPGSLDIRPETFKELVKDISLGLVRQGFRRIIFFSAHGGMNLPILTQVASEVREETGALFAVLHIWSLVSQVSPSLARAPGVAGGHGGDPTTSVMLYLTPDLVDMKKVKWEPLKQPLQGMDSESYTTHTFNKIKVTIPLFVDEISDTGGYADATKASKERGEKVFKAMIEYLVGFVNAFKTLKIPEPPKK